MSQVITSLRTKSGQPLHPVGIGTWKLGEYPLFSPGTDAEVRSLQYALSLGQNHIDTAEMYANGGAERVVGQALEGRDRQDVFITSKLWKNHVAANTVRPAVETMLKRLGTDYLDMLYVHAPWFDAPWQEAIPQIDALIDEGIVRHLGVSNFNVQNLQTALSLARNPIAADQMHYSYAHRQEVPTTLRQLCVANGITLVAYRPIEAGELIDQPLLAELASKYSASATQIALAWLLSQGVLPIPKALSRAHIDENAAATAIDLSAADLQRLNSQNET